MHWWARFRSRGMNKSFKAVQVHESRRRGLILGVMHLKLRRLNKALNQSVFINILCRKLMFIQANSNYITLLAWSLPKAMVVHCFICHGIEWARITGSSNKTLNNNKKMPLLSTRIEEKLGKRKISHQLKLLIIVRKKFDLGAEPNQIKSCQKLLSFPRIISGQKYRNNIQFPTVCRRNFLVFLTSNFLLRFGKGSFSSNRPFCYIFIKMKICIHMYTYIYLHIL